MLPKLPKDKSTIQTAKMGPVKEAYFKEFIFKRHGFSGAPCGAHINLSIDDHIIDLVLKNFLSVLKIELKSRTIFTV